MPVRIGVPGGGESRAPCGWNLKNKVKALALPVPRKQRMEVGATSNSVLRRIQGRATSSQPNDGVEAHRTEGESRRSASLSG